MRAVFGLALLLFAAPLVAGEKKKSFDSFSALRHEILNVIAGATTRVWLASEYLTDGEIVSALYVAQYRKLDVQVLLGRAKANRYMSRLNYLKNQKIPVFLKPRGYKIPAASAVLADNLVVFVDGELDFRSKYTQFNIRYGNPGESISFAKAYAEAAGKKVPAIARKIPLVGRAGGIKSKRRPGRVLPKPVYSPDPNAKGAYTYSNSKKAKGKGVPTRLPRKTKWENKLENGGRKSLPSIKPAPGKGESDYGNQEF